MSEQPERDGSSWIDFLIEVFVVTPVGFLMVPAVGLVIALVPVVLLIGVLGLTLALLAGAGFTLVARALELINDPERFRKLKNKTLTALALCVAIPMAMHYLIRSDSLADSITRLVVRLYLWCVALSFLLRFIFWLTGHYESFWPV